MEVGNKIKASFKNLTSNLKPQKMIKEITPKELQVLILNKTPFQFIDVREPWEKELANIGGELFPLSSIGAAFDELTADTQIIVYCRSGIRSANAIKTIENHLGLTNLYNLKGGILAWADEIDNSIQKY